MNQGKRYLRNTVIGLYALLVPLEIQMDQTTLNAGSVQTLGNLAIRYRD